MRNTFTKKEFALAIACALALGLFSEVASGFGPAPSWTAACHGAGAHLHP